MKKKIDIAALKAEYAQVAKKYYTPEETQLMRELLDAGIVSSKFIHSKGLFPNRTQASIASMIDRVRGEKRGN